MKKQFTKKWRASKQPRKQRKYLHNAPLHLARKNMSSTLSKELRKKHGIRNIEVRKGDEVEVMRGKFKKKFGKVTDVNTKYQKIAIENIQRTKRDGTKINVYLHPSVVRIKVLADDKKRFKIINKKEEKNAQEKK